MVKPAKEALSDKQQAQVISYLDSVNTKSPTGATNLRKNLILNGIDFIKEKPFLGLGPGGYSLKCKEKEVRHFVNSHTSAHNFPIEVISEFGVFGWLYFVFLLFILVQLFKKREFIDFRLRNSFLYFVIALPLLWMMPSAFLYLNIHWLFLPLLIILNESIKDNLNPDGVKQ
jgi:O-antigen ligase